MSKRRPKIEKNTNKNTVEEISNPQQADVEANIDTLGSILSVIASGLFFSRWFLPTEAAVDGETLWVVFLLLIVAAAWGVRNFLNKSSSIAFNWLDVSVAVLVSGHVLSSVVVICSEGQKRAATNMMWEWIGVGVTFFLLRQFFQKPEIKQSFFKVAVSLCVVLSGFGIYQHYVEYPALRNDFIQIEKEIAETSSEDGQKWNQLQMKLAELGIPSDAKKRSQLAQRIIYSSEPFGFFGLANSFATFMLIGFLLVMVLSVNQNEFSQDSKKLGRLALYALFFVLIGYCLLLTKSRTALIGTFVAVFLFGLLLARRTLVQNQKLIRIAVVGFCVAVLLVGIAIATGSFDLAVLTESSKSLKYRMEYWQASLGVISEAPFFGVGPGQFRQTYLKYKLPESSESILDPHNLILDVWANGGLIALVGLMLTVFFGFRYLFKTDQEENSSKVQVKTEITMGLTAFVLAYLVPFIIGLGFDDRLIVLAVVWIAVHFGWNYLGAERVSSNAISLFGMIAFSGVTIHLLGAGGIAMPALTLVWLLGPLLSQLTKRKFPAYGNGVIAVLAISGAVLLNYSALSPVLNTKEQLQIALSASSESAQKEALRKASEDSFDPEPRLFKAQMAFGKWKNQPENSGQFTEAIVLLKEAKQKDPGNVEFLKMEGQWWLAKFKETNSQQDAKKAKDALSKASKMSPTDVLLLVNFAISCDAEGDFASAAEISQKVLEMDQTNQRLGHVDKVLDDDLVKKMTKLAGFDENPNNN